MYFNACRVLNKIFGAIIAITFYAYSYQVRATIFYYLHRLIIEWVIGKIVLLNSKVIPIRFEIPYKLTLYLPFKNEKLFIPFSVF